MVVRELITKLGFRVETSGAKKYDGIIKTLKNDAIGAFHGIRTSLRLFSIASKVIWAKAIKDNFEYASSLTEVEDSLRRTFNELYDDIDKWSREAGKQFGLSELQAKRYNMSMGAILKTAGITSPQFAEMSKELVGLSADLASFYNITNDSAMHKIRSAMSGYTIGLRQLGINMSDVDIQDYLMTQGIKKSYYQMTDAEKYIARYNFLLSRTTMIQGDFTNALEGSFYNYKRLLASKWQNIAEKIFHGATPQAIRFAREVRFIFESVERKLGDLEVELGLFWGKLARKIGKLYYDIVNLFILWKKETNNFQGTRELIDALGDAFKKAFNAIGSLISTHIKDIDDFMGKLAEVVRWVTDNPELAAILFGIGQLAIPIVKGAVGKLAGTITTAITGAEVTSILSALAPIATIALLVYGIWYVVTHQEDIFKPYADPETIEEDKNKALSNYGYNRAKAEQEKEEWSKKGGAFGELKEKFWDGWLKDTPFGKHMSSFFGYLGGLPSASMEALKEGGTAGNNYMQRAFATHYNTIQNQNNNITNNITVNTSGTDDAKQQGIAFSQGMYEDLSNRINSVGSKIPAPSY
jgi:hypothetical protein